MVLNIDLRRGKEEPEKELPILQYSSWPDDIIWLRGGNVTLKYVSIKLYLCNNAQYFSQILSPLTLLLDTFH